jgi:hypothetical protein
MADFGRAGRLPKVSRPSIAVWAAQYPCVPIKKLARDYGNAP